MNAKAERIEQVIQIVNRNLQLVFSGQNDGMAYLDARVLQRIDTSIFGNDKFAYEMLHYVKMSNRSSTSGGVSALWDRHFLKGLETLLVECAVVKDEIERDCFISRVYSWFTEKIVERRDLPRGAIDGENMAALKKSVQSMGGVHTAKALDKFMQSSISAPNSDKKEQNQAKEKKLKDIIPSSADLSHTTRKPLSSSPSGAVSQSQPLYVSHTYANLSFNGSVPGGRETEREGRKISGEREGERDEYGMMYGEPQSEAEKGVHALFIAKRRQEAFEWKAKQQLSLVLDRRALHLSRVESDALRRTESSSMMNRSSQSSHSQSSSTRYAPEVRRPFSAKRRSAATALGTWPSDADRLGPIERESERGRERVGMESPNGRYGAGPPSPSSLYPPSSPNGAYAGGPYSISSSPTADMGIMNGHMDRQSSLRALSATRADPADAEHIDISILMKSTGYESENASVPRTTRNAVTRRSKESKVIPMKYRHDLPEDYRRNVERLRRYLQDNSDSDEEKEGERRVEIASPAVSSPGSTNIPGPDRMLGIGAGGPLGSSGRGVVGGIGTGSGTASINPSAGMNPALSKTVPVATGNTSSAVPVTRRVVKKSVVRERPLSAVRMKELAAHDPELQVHYRHANYRRMMVTGELEYWIDEKEGQRRKKMNEHLAELRAKAGHKQRPSSRGKISSEKSSLSTSMHRGKISDKAAQGKVVPKYKSADQFMSIHFPSFDKVDNEDSFGPMRAGQLSECDRIQDVFADANIDINEEVLHKALLIPQDRPEIICLENLRGGNEGLMVNPLPKEYWRKSILDKMASKKKSKKKSKK